MNVVDAVVVATATTTTSVVVDDTVVFVCVCVWGGFWRSFLDK